MAEIWVGPREFGGSFFITYKVWEIPQWSYAQCLQPRVPAERHQLQGSISSIIQNRVQYLKGETSIFMKSGCKTAFWLTKGEERKTLWKVLSLDYAVGNGTQHGDLSGDAKYA